MQLQRVTRRSLLGDERTVEAMDRGVRTKRRERVVLVVVERSRLGATCVAEAYEQVVPIIQRSRGTQVRDGARGPVEEQRGMAGGQR